MPVNEEKQQYAARMNRMLDTYSKILFCSLDNVRSEQMHSVRIALRGKGEVLVGKKTMQKKIITTRADSADATPLDKALHKALCTDNRLVGNLGLVFTNADVTEVQKILTSFRVQAPARVGAISPVEVVVPAGNTGLEPTQTSFFQALNIPTKITKGTVEITADKKVLSVGDKVDSSTAALLQKLNISPFFYCAEVVFYWDCGLLFSVEDLSVTNAIIEQNLLTSISNLTAVSLATGILTEASFPHAILDGFKNLLAASVESDYVFEEFNGKRLRQDVKEGKVAAAPAAAASTASAAPAAAAAAKKPEVVEEEEDDFSLGGLF
jgi:large subunit ribosomal protein LP0